MGWMLHTVLGGGVVLLVCWLALRWVAGPARRQRLAEWGGLAALLLSVLSLGPSWLTLPFSPAPLPAPAAAVPAPPPPPEQPFPLPAAKDDDALVFLPAEESLPAPAAEAAAPPVPGPDNDSPLSLPEAST